MLSFPRDLYVTIAGSGNQARINSAYRRDDPQRLIDTIYENFGIGIDHFIQVDFCTFKTLVDAVGGVTVPFEYPARDPNTGLNVPTPGCFTFDGDHALAYVAVAPLRVRGPAGQRQLGGGPVVRPRPHLPPAGLPAPHAVERARQGPAQPERGPRPDRGGDRRRRRHRRGLSLAKLMEFAGVLRDVEPASIPTYQIEADGREIGGASVLEPRIDGDNMQAVLAMFRGETSLGRRPGAGVRADDHDAAPRHRQTGAPRRHRDGDAPPPRPGGEHVRHRPAPRRPVLRLQPGAPAQVDAGDRAASRDVTC